MSLKKNIFLLLLITALLFIDISGSLGFIYFPVIIVYVASSWKNNYTNEVIVSFSLFGFSFCAGLSQLLQTPNLILFALFSFLLLFLSKLVVRKTDFLSLNNPLLIITYLVFFLSIIFSMVYTEFYEYQTLKINLFITYTAVYGFSLLSISSSKLKSFNYTRFLLLSVVLFLPHYSLISSDNGASSPYEIWTSFSSLANGLRTINFDVITASRISGAGFTIAIFFLLSNFRKYFWTIPILLIFTILLINSQTRQGIISMVLAVLVYFVYRLLNSKKSYGSFILPIALVGAAVYKYMSFSEENETNSRILNNSDDNGRSLVFEQTVNYIEQRGSLIGFGNYSGKINEFHYPHNIFLEAFIELGYLGFVALLSIILIIIIYSYRIVVLNKMAGEMSVLLLMLTIYFLTTAQFSADIPRNMLFLYTFILFVGYNNHQKPVN